ncbi:hypothetical protein [Bacillus toyonensis]|uniref:hypothetical protein n=1 Tax=Bacillus toyonensis TaxID=155322 RepID=UPI00027BEA57|nr:hypothetical protein [Bacillus toyonensis]EJV41755.1 hypothetical protein IEA_05640 [Bacillus toyonensis]
MEDWYGLILLVWYIATVPLWIFLPLHLTTETLNIRSEYLAGWLCIVLVVLFAIIDTAILLGICYVFGI